VHDHAEVPAAPGIQVGDVRLDPTRRTVYVGETPVELSGREFLVMTHLMSHAGETVSRQELLSDIWGLTFDPGSNVVDVCVARLRAKIDGTRIETVRNVGYSFRSA
jgi:DNA-binding response OmpR family regulator